MSVPSYDDLTPGIPDVIGSDTAERLTSFLQLDLYRRSGDQEKSCKRTGGKELVGHENPNSSFSPDLLQVSPGLLTSCLYACLRLKTADCERLPTANCQLLTVARDFSPRIMQVSAREILLDVSGLGRLIGPPDEIERRLAHAIFDAGLSASVAIAPTQSIARLLAHAAETGHGLTLRHKDHKAHEDYKENNGLLCDLCGLRGLCAGACRRGAWQPLSVDLLRELEMLPPAMGHRDRARPYEIFEKWGIATLGDLAALPADQLSSRLGRRGVALHRLARGIDPAPFVPDAETPRYTGRLELEWPIDALEPLSFVLARLLDPLSAALERADRGAVAVHLDLRLTDRSTYARLLQLPAPMRDPRVLRTLLLLDLESHPPSAAIDIVTIELDPAPGRITQFSLLQRALPSPETLSTLTARLSALMEESRVGSPVLLDSHAPDAFGMARYAPERASDDRWPMTDDPKSRIQDSRPSTNDHRPSSSMLRRHRPPLALRVAVEHGRPVHIASSRRGVPYGAIVESAGPWRTSGGWWERGQRAEGRGDSDAGRAEGNEGAVGKGPWNRDEWDVALKSGAVCRIYRDRSVDCWFLDGVYD